MDGLLIVDKPSGPTSHDVVARMRRVLREKRIGHTGTLDPMATGVLLLVVGKATRLAKFLSASDKSYDAVVRFGFATDTADAQGLALGPVSEGPMPSRDEIDKALDESRGTFLQQPPAFSAKKIAGQRSHHLARTLLRGRESIAVSAIGAPQNPQQHGTQQMKLTPDPLLPSPVSVTTTRIEILATESNTVTLRLDCSAGFYVRSLAHDLGARLGVGAHLAALRRTRAGAFALDRAIPLDDAEQDPQRAISALVPLAAMLPGLPTVTLTAGGVTRAVHGQDVRPADIEQGVGIWEAGFDGSDRPLVRNPESLVRMLDEAGRLVAIGRSAGASALLHPSVVLV